MADFEVVEGLETSDDLNEEVPDLALGKVGVVLLVLVDHLEEIAAVCVLHNDTEAHVLKEVLLVTDHIGMVDRGEDANFVQGVLFFFAGELAHFYFLHSVDGAVRLSLDAVHFAEAALA